MKKTLITGATSFNETYFEKLEKIGLIIDFLQDESDKIEDYSKYEIVICNALFLHHEISKFTNLKYVHLTSVGTDRVPMDYIKKNNIELCVARGVYSIPMAEFAISGVLQLYKKSEFFSENKKEHRWEKNRELLELNEKTVCIVGCGSVGSACAKRFKAFDCNVIGVDIHFNSNENFDGIYSMESLDKCLGKSDIVVLTLPLNEESRFLFNKERFSKFKNSAILVNLARGTIVEESALIDALGNKLAGAVLDVFEHEPLRSDSALWDMKNVILTPHNSFVGEKNTERLFELVYKNLCEWV